MATTPSDPNHKPKLSLSLVINTHQSESTLARAIRSVPAAGEVVVMDMASEDKTVEVARALGARVYRHRPLGFVEPARAAAVARARQPWVLILDADEELSPALARRLPELISAKNQVEAYYLPRRNLVFGTALRAGGWWPDYQLRLFRVGQVEWSDRLHQPPTVHGRSLHLAVKEDEAIIHHHYDSLDAYLTRLYRYTQIEAEQRQASLSTQSNTQSTTSSATPVAGAFLAHFLAEFNRRYFAQAGWQDGTRGEALALLQSFYQLLTELRIWEADGFPELNLNVNLSVDKAEKGSAFRQALHELHYWYSSQRLAQAKGWRRLAWRLRRRFRL